MPQFAVYEEAIAPDCCFVIGLALRPLCLGHLAILQKIRSPYSLGKESEASNSDLILAACICSKSWEEARDSISSPSAGLEIRRWRRAATRRWLFFRRPIDWIKEHLAFQSYLYSGMLIPKFWAQQDNTGTRYGAPTELSLKLALIKLGYSESEAMNMYLPYAWFNLLAARELEGGKQILYSQEDEKAWEEARRIEGGLNGP